MDVKLTKGSSWIFHMNDMDKIKKRDKNHMGYNENGLHGRYDEYFVYSFCGRGKYNYLVNKETKKEGRKPELFDYNENKLEYMCEVCLARAIKKSLFDISFNPTK